MSPWIATAFGLAMTGLGAAITGLDSYRPSLMQRKRRARLTRRTMIQFRVLALPAVSPRFARGNASHLAICFKREKP